MNYYDESQEQYEEIAVQSTDNMPVGAVIEYSGNDVPVGWEKVNDYSTTEIDTGKTYIDGKKIYKITFQESDYTQGQNFNISISALNVDKLVISPYGMTFDGTQQIPIPFANQNNEVNYVFRNGSNLACRLQYGTSADITIEYTKTS